MGQVLVDGIDGVESTVVTEAVGDRIEGVESTVVTDDSEAWISPPQRVVQEACYLTEK